MLDEWCAKLGRDPGHVERTVAISPQEIGDAYVEAGATHLIVMVGQPFDLTSVGELLEAARG